MSAGRLRLAGSAAALALVPAASGCGNAVSQAPEGPPTASPRAATSLQTQRFPELMNVRPQRLARDTFDFMVLVSSPYDSPRRHGDGWRVLSLGGRTLSEKRYAYTRPAGRPLWRRQTGVRMPAGTRRVQLEGHDSRNGYGGRRLTVSLP